MSWTLEYFTVLRVAASSAAEPASRAAAATYESANGQMTVTSQVSGFVIVIIIIIMPSYGWNLQRLQHPRNTTTTTTTV